MLLAKVNLKSLDGSALEAQLNQSKLEGKHPELQIQSHVTVEGSLNERLESARIAFSEWSRVYRDNTNDYDYYWSSLLAIFDDSVVFYCSDYPGYRYYRLSMDWDGNKATLTGEPVAVDVSMVVKTLGVEEQSAADDEKDKMKEQATNQTPQEAPAPQEQDGIESKSGSVVTGTPDRHFSDDGKNVPQPQAEANSAGASVPAPNSLPLGHDQPHHSGSDATGAASDNSGSGAVAAELSKTAEGLKQDEPAVEVVGNAEFLIQGSPFNSHNESMSFIQEFKSDDETPSGKLLSIQGIATRADILSASGYVYPLAIWQKNLEPMNELAQAGKFTGKLEHPDREQGLVDTAIKFNKFWMQGSDLWFDGVVIPTDPHGKNLQAMIEAGVQIDISSRGYGSAKKQQWRGQSVNVIQDDFVCVGFDAVMHGASTGSRITEASYQSQSLEEENQKPMKTQAQIDAEQRAADLRQSQAFTQGKADLLAASGLSPVGQTAYQKALDRVEEGDLPGLFQASDNALDTLRDLFPAATTEGGAAAAEQTQTYSPQFYTAKSQAEIAPQNLNQLFDRMVEDLPDTNGLSRVQDAPEGADQDLFLSPRKQCRKMLVNMATMQHEGFHGPSAAFTLLALEQGRIAQAKDILEQSLPAGATTASGNVDPGGAPLSAPMIFPLVRRVFPRYIMNEIATIQPMDRPNGKIFYLDHYRTETPAPGQEQRIDLNTSAVPFNSSYADNPTEGAAVQQIRLKLSSVSVDAYTKKLAGTWSIEEVQDLWAYHRLDASTEIMDGTAKEMAIEWNKTVLDDMLAQATGAALTFGKTPPASGYPNHIDWKAEIWAYVEQLDNLIFSKRNGPMTHLICGIDAATALVGAARATFDIGGENGGDMRTKYPGATFFGVENNAGQKYVVVKTNFWGTGTPNASKILGLRKGEGWSDTPYIWAPYADYITPLLTDPSDFSQKQGIMSRAAKKVVVSDAMGYITVNNSVGVPL